MEGIANGWMWAGFALFVVVAITIFIVHNACIIVIYKIVDMPGWKIAILCIYKRPF